MNFKHWMPAVLALAVAAAPAIAVQETVQKDWTTLRGSISGVSRYRTVDVRDAETWTTLWKEHTSIRTDAPPPPFVDFEKERVIAIFLGSRTYGHGVDLEVTPNKAANALVVSLKEEKPSGKGFAVTMMAQPFVFRRETKSFKTVVFPAAPAAAPATPPAAKKKKLTSKPLAANKTVAALVEGLSGLRDSVGTAYDGASVKSGAVSASGIVLTGGKPLPGQRQDQGKPLPNTQKQDSGKPLPGTKPKQGKPLPGSGGGKPLPGQDRGGKPLPGGSVHHPRPAYPGGPLPGNDPRLEGAERTYTTYGMQYIGFWNGKTYYSTSQGTLNRDGKNAGTRYSLTLTSRQMKKRYDFYYDPADKQYYWVPDETPMGGRRTRDLAIVFTNPADAPLYPWEAERFVFSLTGSQLSIDSQSGAYRYSGTFTSDANDPTVVTALLTAGAKVLTAPDASGVTAGIQATGSGLKLVINDKWAAEYAGESLEIAAIVRWDDGSMWRRDPVVFKADSRSPLRFAAAKTLEHEFAASKRGKYYLESWSFRRAGSKISSDRWVNRGQGNSVTR